MDESRRGLKPWSFRSRLMMALLLCSFAAAMVAFVCAYLVSRSDVRSEMTDAERETAIYLLGLDQKTALTDEDIARMASSDSLEVSLIEDASGHLSQTQLDSLNSYTILTVSPPFMSIPVTYVKLSGSVARIVPSSRVDLVLSAVLRVLFGGLAFLIVFILMALVAAGKIARPISRMTQATARVAEGDFTVRLPEVAGGEIGELMRSFNRMTDALSRTSYLQKDFIASISHEFRTPITSIAGFAHLLQMPGLNESDRQEYVSLIAAESTRLSRLSDTLLRLSSLEQQSGPAEMTTFRLDEQLRQVILRLEPAWDARKLEWSLSLDPVTVTSDEELLCQVWINLISNAVKFSPEGAAVEILCYQAEDTVVEITDHGPGMDEATVERIFDRFYQADKSRAREGAGLGLCLVKRILDMLGGSVRVRTSPGEGSTFRVRLTKTPKQQQNGGNQHASYDR